MDGFDPEAPVAAAELRRFALTLGGAFALLAAVGLWRGRSAPAAVFGLLGALLLAGGLLAPGRLGPVYQAWMRLAHGMSRVTTPLFLGVIYFGVFAPLGLLMRLSGRRALGGPGRGGSYWVERAPGARRSDLRRQF